MGRRPEQGSEAAGRDTVPRDQQWAGSEDRRSCCLVYGFRRASLQLTPSGYSSFIPTNLPELGRGQGHALRSLAPLLGRGKSVGGQSPLPLFPQQGAQGVSRVLAGLQDGRGRLDRSTGTLDTWPAEPPPPG